MSGLRILAFVLIAAGIFGLTYHHFTYTKDTQEAKVGPIALTVKDNKTIDIPVWAGVGAIAIGGILLLVRRRA